MNLETMRLIVTNNMPYDTGFMFMNGAKFFQTNHFLICKYDTDRVPYIVFQEEGTIYSTKNKYFIREKTVGDIIRHLQYERNGLRAPEEKLEERAKRRASNIFLGQGVIEKLRTEGSLNRYAGNI